MADEWQSDPYVDRVENGHRPLTDEGNALRLGDDWKHALRRLELRRAWAVCRNERWTIDDSDSSAYACMRETAWGIHDEAARETDPVTRPLLEAHATRCGAAARIDAAVRLARSDARMQVETKDFDAKTNIIASHEHVLELTNDPEEPVIWRNLSSKDMVTYTTAARYNPPVLENPPDLVTNYQETFLKNEKRRELLFRVLGSALLGGNPDRLFVIFKGPTTTGKSQLVEALENALGEYATTAPPSIFRGNFDDKARPDLLDVLWRRVLFLSEAGQAWELHGDRIKDLVGGGIIRARGMRSNEYVAVRPQFLPILVTNDLPRVIGVDTATRRRLLVIDFPHRFTGQEDTSVKQRFTNDPEVHEWLLARLVQGYMDYVKYGLDDVLSEFSINSAAAFEDLSTVGPFLEWSTLEGYLTTLGPDSDDYGVAWHDVRLKDFYEHYKFWINHRGDNRDKREMLSYKNFNNDLRNAHGWESVPSGGLRWANRRLDLTATDEVQLPWGQ